MDKLAHWQAGFLFAVLPISECFAEIVKHKPMVLINKTLVTFSEVLCRSHSFISKDDRSEPPFGK